MALPQNTPSAGMAQRHRLERHRNLGLHGVGSAVALADVHAQRDPID